MQVPLVVRIFASLLFGVAALCLVATVALVPTGVVALLHAGDPLAFFLGALVSGAMFVVCARLGRQLSNESLWARIYLARGQCPRCLYSIRGTAAGRCPECGQWLAVGPDGPSAETGRGAND